MANGFLEFLKDASLISLPFSIYLSWKKIGYKVSAKFWMEGGLYSASRIVSLSLSNMKDRPLAIFEIYALLENKIFTIKKFRTPLILKAFEAENIECDEVSNYYFEGKPINISISSMENIKILLSTSEKIVECSNDCRPDRLSLLFKKKLKIVSSDICTINGLAYNDRAKYAVIFKRKGEVETYFINKKGMISWKMLPNAIPVESLISEEEVRKVLEKSELAKLISPFKIEKLDYKSPYEFTS